VIELLLKALASYLIGSILGCRVMGWPRGIDIRRLGSGNAGSTHALRTQGRAFALGVFVIDVGKGWLATRVIAHLPLSPAVSDPALVPWLGVSCALAAVLGHAYPLGSGFRGGKALATLLGAVLGLHAWLLAPMLLAWAAGFGLTGFVGLASLLATAALCLALLVSGEEPRLPLQSFAGLSLPQFLEGFMDETDPAGCEPSGASASTSQEVGAARAASRGARRHILILRCGPFRMKSQSQGVRAGDKGCKGRSEYYILNPYHRRRAKARAAEGGTRQMPHD
jgi:glycerol-3-phosphate acyltransferase PlsY